MIKPSQNGPLINLPLKSGIFLLLYMLIPLGGMTLLSAHELNRNSLTNDNTHDDLAPTLEEESQIIERAEKERIGYNPDIIFEIQAVSINSTAHLEGHWDSVQNWPIVPVFVSLLHNGNVLAYDSVGDAPTESFQNHDFTRSTVWNPTSNQFTDVQVDTGYNLFCSGFASMPDGQLFIAGGNANSALNGLLETHVFSPSAQSWNLGSRMSFRRWYPSVTPLANGEMLITGGGPSTSEVRQIDGQIRQLTNAAQNYWANEDYPWLQTAPDGRVAFFGPHSQLGYLTTSGTGAWNSMQQRDDENRTYGSYAMYDIGKVLVTGGGKESSNHSQRSSLIINLNNNSVSSTDAMAFRRRQHTLTILADGSVLATGGFSSNEGLVDLDNAVFAAELWDPDLETWTTLASESRARQYHSTALLLPDGRILSAGGGICGSCQQLGYLQKNAQIFSPPYLFRSDGTGNLATRPVIENAPGEVGYAQMFQVETHQANEIRKVGLVRIGSVTHSQNMEQRYVPLTFVEQNNGLEINPPDNGSIAPPGYYMLFIVDSAGVPSVSKMLRLNDIVTPTPPPTDNIVQIQNLRYDGYLTASSNGQEVTMNISPQDDLSSWELVPVDNSSQFHIRNVSTGLNLDADSDRDVDLSSGTGEDKQWNVVDLGNGIAHFKNVRDNLYLDGDSDFDVDLSSDQNTTDMQWRLLNL